MDMGFLRMLGTYEERKVALYEDGDLCVDTVRVIDAVVPFETGVSHPSFNNGEWVIVEEYSDSVAAKAGHKLWVEKMTADPMPQVLRDVSSATVTRLKDDEIGGTDWREIEAK